MNSEMMMKSPSKMKFYVLVALVALPILYLSSCSYISSKRNKAFNSVEIGANEKSIVDAFAGAPSLRETSKEVFARYASRPCRAPCAERLWYENRLSFDIEAWSFEMDESGRVISKDKWMSP